MHKSLCFCGELENVPSPSFGSAYLWPSQPSADERSLSMTPFLSVNLPLKIEMNQSFKRVERVRIFSHDVIG